MSNPYVRVPQDEMTSSFFDENFGTTCENINTYMQCVNGVIHIELGDFGEMDAELTDEITREYQNLQKFMSIENSTYLCDILKKDIIDDIPSIQPMKTKNGVCVQTRVYNYAPTQSTDKFVFLTDKPKYDTQYPFTFVVKFYSS